MLCDLMENSHNAIIIKSKNRRQVTKNTQKSPKNFKSQNKHKQNPISPQKSQNHNFLPPDPKEKKKKVKEPILEPNKETVNISETELISTELICPICQDQPKEKAKIQECPHEFWYISDDF
jgi:hypothetical protein